MTRSRRNVDGRWITPMIADAPTNGSIMFANAKPIAIPTVWPCVRSTAISATPTTARNTGQVRRGVRISTAKVMPAGGKKAAPASGVFRYQKGKSAPIAYKPASGTATMTTRVALLPRNDAHGLDTDGACTAAILLAAVDSRSLLSLDVMSIPSALDGPPP